MKLFSNTIVSFLFTVLLSSSAFSNAGDVAVIDPVLQPVHKLIESRQFVNALDEIEAALDSGVSPDQEIQLENYRNIISVRRNLPGFVQRLNAQDKQDQTSLLSLKKDFDHVAKGLFVEALPETEKAGWKALSQDLETKLAAHRTYFQSAVHLATVNPVATCITITATILLAMYVYDSVNDMLEFSRQLEQVNRKVAEGDAGFVPQVYETVDNGLGGKTFVLRADQRPVKYQSVDQKVSELDSLADYTLSIKRKDMVHENAYAPVKPEAEKHPSYWYVFSISPTQEAKMDQKKQHYLDACEAACAKLAYEAAANEL